MSNSFDYNLCVNNPELAECVAASTPDYSVAIVVVTVFILAVALDFILNAKA